MIEDIPNDTGVTLKRWSPSGKYRNSLLSCVYAGSEPVPVLDIPELFRNYFARGGICGTFNDIYISRGSRPADFSRLNYFMSFPPRRSCARLIRGARIYTAFKAPLQADVLQQKLISLGILSWLGGLQDEADLLKISSQTRSRRGNIRCGNIRAREQSESASEFSHNTDRYPPFWLFRKF